MKKQAGFTMIELIIVIVILGILAATAVPRFIDMSDEAETAAVQGVAGAITSASAINYGAASAGADGAVNTNGETCEDAAEALLQGGVPDGYTLTNSVAATDGTASTCEVEHDASGKTADATIISVTVTTTP